MASGKATHLTDPHREDHTLCGLRWWFNCDLGTDHYCRKCQAALSKRKKKGEYTE